MFGFGKKDPVCGMKEKKGSGIIDGKNWFCSKECQDKFKASEKDAKKNLPDCCK